MRRGGQSINSVVWSWPGAKVWTPRAALGTETRAHPGAGGHMSVAETYHPNQDQLAIAGAMDDALVELLPIARLHQASEESADTWAQLDALGSFGISLAEDAGGAGLGAAEEALIVVALGRRLASPTVLA